MKVRFLSREYLALNLIAAKSKIFYESFITISELNQFQEYLQQELNSRNLNIIITNDILSKDNFNTLGEVIKKSSNYFLRLDLLQSDILSIISDTNIITNFLIGLEQNKIETLQKVKTLQL